VSKGLGRSRSVTEERGLLNGICCLVISRVSPFRIMDDYAKFRRGSGVVECKN